MSKTKNNVFFIDDSITDMFGVFQSHLATKNPTNGYGFFRKESLITEYLDSDEDVDDFPNPNHINNCWASNQWTREALICIDLSVPLEECISYAFLCNKMFEDIYPGSVIKYVRGSSSKYGTRVFYVDTGDDGSSHYSPFLRLTTAFRSICGSGGNNDQCYEFFKILADNLCWKCKGKNWRDYKSFLLPENKLFVKSLSDLLVLSRMLETNENKSLMNTKLTIPSFVKQKYSDINDQVSGFLYGYRIIYDIASKIEIRTLACTVCMGDKNKIILKGSDLGLYFKHYGKTSFFGRFLTLPQIDLVEPSNVVKAILDSNKLPYLPNKLGDPITNKQIKEAVEEAIKKHAYENQTKFILKLTQDKPNESRLVGGSTKTNQEVYFEFNKKLVDKNMLKKFNIEI